MERVNGPNVPQRTPDFLWNSRFCYTHAPGRADMCENINTVDNLAGCVITKLLW